MSHQNSKNYAGRCVRLLAAILLVAWLVSPVFSSLQAAEKSAEPFHWQGPLKSGQAIEIKGVNGGIKAEAASNGKVEVTAQKSGHRSDPAQVEIKVVEHGGGVTICAVYPSENSSQPNECKPGEGGRMSTHNNDVKVDFTVRVPQGVRFIGRSVNGGIEASALPDDVEAHTVNGGIHISGGKFADATTVNGGITASIGSAGWTKPLHFTTVNGGVDVSLPAGANAEVEAQTVNGSISTDFPLTVQGKFGPKSIHGTIGSGGPKITLTTVNGSVQLRRNP
jgi:DUF4097 and DUF4098 domain-containing protein YvlB